MASVNGLNWEALLAPIPGDSPTGVDLRQDASPALPFYAIKDARKAAARAENTQVSAYIPGEEGGNSSSPPDWAVVLRRAEEALSKKTKDLEITVYAIEALLRLKGFAGLRDGFRLARKLIELYWEGLYPLPDEDGVAGRVAPLVSLNGVESDGTLPGPIYATPLTEETSIGRFVFAHYHDAVAVAKIADPQKREQRESQGMSLKALNQAVAETADRKKDYYTNLLSDIEQSIEQFDRLCAVLTVRCGNDAPPSGQISTALATCRDIVRDVAKAHLSAPAPGPATEPAPTTNGEQSPPGTPRAPAVSADAIRSREDALSCLEKVAEFFRRTEPHTVVSYALEQAVRWGRMPLPDLLMELIPDPTARESLFKQVGIPPRS